METHHCHLLPQSHRPLISFSNRFRLFGSFKNVEQSISEVRVSWPCLVAYSFNYLIDDFFHFRQSLLLWQFFRDDYVGDVGHAVPNGYRQVVWSLDSQRLLSDYIYSNDDSIGKFIQKLYGWFPHRNSIRSYQKSKLY